MNHSFSVNAIILKRFNYQESDRIIVMFSREHGKIQARARGARKQTSRKKGSLEPGTLGRYQLVNTKGFPLLTQATITNSHAPARGNLVRITQLHQLLEVVDSLTVDDQSNEVTFDLLEASLCLLDQAGHHKHKLLANMHQIIISMGFAVEAEVSESLLQSQIESISEKRLKSKPFLTPAYLRLE
jgi:DNA repair protein RecO